MHCRLLGISPELGQHVQFVEGTLFVCREDRLVPYRKRFDKKSNFFIKKLIIPVLISKCTRMSSGGTYTYILRVNRVQSFFIECRLINKTCSRSNKNCNKVLFTKLKKIYIFLANFEV